jgi:hypothetical protein
MQGSVQGTWPFSIPQATLSEIFAMPLEARRKMLLELCRTTPAQFDAGVARFGSDGAFGQVFACLLGLLSSCDPEAGLPLDLPSLSAIVTYFDDRKSSAPFVASPGNIGSRSAPHAARGVHLFCLLSSVWRYLIGANEVLGRPLPEFPAPQAIFDGATWQVVYRSAVRSQKLPPNTIAFLTTFCPAVVAAALKPKPKPKPKPRQQTPAAASAAPSASEKQKSEDRIANPFDQLDDKDRDD